MKLNADGTYGWTRSWNGARVSFVGGEVALGADGSAVVTGVFSDTVDFDPTADTDLHSALPGASSLFVTKIDNEGKYSWTRSFASTDKAIGVDAAVGPTGHVVVTGSFRGDTDFGSAVEPDLRVPVGSDDIFITELGPQGTPEWTRTVGSVSPGESGRRIVVGPSQSVAVSGVYSNTIDLNPGCGLQEHSPATSSDRFVVKLVCPEPTGDTNDDGLIDLIDFAAIQRCFSGPAPTTCGDGCESLDLDADDDIDLDDYLIFDATETP
jgi:hypothetical protein